MMSIDKLKKLKDKVEELKREQSRAEGRLQEAQKRLKEEFNVSTLGAAKKLLKQLEVEEDLAQKEFEMAWASFQEEWEGKL